VSRSLACNRHSPPPKASKRAITPVADCDLWLVFTQPVDASSAPWSDLFSWITNVIHEELIRGVSLVLLREQVRGMKTIRPFLSQ
jgi:hypothetical protein